MKKIGLVLILRIAYCAVASFGILVTLLRMTDPLVGLAYYTIQSNVIGLGVMILAVIRGLRRPADPGRLLSLLKPAASALLVVTFLVYHFMLSPTISPDYFATSAGWASNLAVHYLCPLWITADFFLFDLRGMIRKTDPLLWAAYPLFYLILVNVLAWAGVTYEFDGNVSRYPYFFINPDVMPGGWAGVALAVLALIVSFLLLFYGFYFLDRHLAKHSRKTPKTAR